MTIRVLVAISGCVAALAFPASAAAAKCAPPGLSGVDEYYETIPGGSCSVAPPGFGGEGGGGARLAPRARRRLAALGPVGGAVERLVASSAPPRVGGGGLHAPPRAGAGGSPSDIGASSDTAGRTTVRSAGGRGPVSGLLDPILSGAGTGSGLLLPGFLAAVVVLAVALGLLARRAHPR